jgi:hypothetical protein
MIMLRRRTIRADGHVFWLSRTRCGVLTCLIRRFCTGFLVSERSADELGVVGVGVGGALFAADEEEEEEQGEEG